MGFFHQQKSEKICVPVKLDHLPKVWGKKNIKTSENTHLENITIHLPYHGPKTASLNQNAPIAPHSSGRAALNMETNYPNGGAKKSSYLITLTGHIDEIYLLKLDGYLYSPPFLWILTHAVLIFRKETPPVFPPKTCDRFLRVVSTFNPGGFPRFHSHPGKGDRSKS